MSFKNSAGGKAFIENIWKENPVFRQVLGICSTLAVTNLLKNTLLMCAGLIFTTAFSSMTVSMLRKHTPKQVRMMVQVLIIAAYVIIVDITIKAYYPEVHKFIGPYVGLIITNCIIMGRCEAFATQNPPGASFLDGMGAGIGYTVVLASIAIVRELMGFGTLLGYQVLNLETKWTIMVMPPGAFFMLAIVAWIGITFSNAKPKEGGAK